MDAAVATLIFYFFNLRMEFAWARAQQAPAAHALFDLSAPLNECLGKLI